MNIALPALIVFAILLPGFIVRSRFKRPERASLDYSPFGQVVTEAVLWATILHACWLFAAAALGSPLQPDVLLKLMSSDGDSQAKAIDMAARDAQRIALYFGSLLAFAYAAPVVARKAITTWRLDRADAKLSWLLRFHRAPWYYLLTGADFAAEDEPDLIVVSAVVQVADQPVLYTGILEDFYLDQDGQLVLQRQERGRIARALLGPLLPRGRRLLRPSLQRSHHRQHRVREATSRQHRAPIAASGGARLATQHAGRSWPVLKVAAGRIRSVQRVRSRMRLDMFGQSRAQHR